MRKVYLLLGSLLLITACDNDLDQVPPNIATSDSLEDFGGVLNAAYFYQHASVTPMAVMGDFRADNAFMDEEPYPAFDRFNSDLADGSLNNQFFRPFYIALYRSILSANNVIENSTDPIDVGEAKFLRALSYFKLVQMFGDVTVNLSASPNPTDTSMLARQPVADVYNNVIIPDLQDAIAALDPELRSDGRATRYAAQGLLGKVYVTRGDFGNAESQLAAVVNGAAAAGFSLQANFADIFGVDNDLNSEIIFATQISSSVADEYGFSEFWSWSGGLDTKSLLPLDASLVAAFDAVANDTLVGGDLRRGVTIDEAVSASPKFPQAGGPDHDWIELRLADVLLLYAETLNENGSSPAEALGVLDDIRTRAGLTVLDPATINTQALVRQAIADERRLELAFEGQRWFDLVRTGTAQSVLGFSDANYLVAPIPISEITSSEGVITQNPGY
jgi:hypothetical protein